MSKSCIKTILIVFFGVRGIVHFELVPQDDTVNSAFRLQVLERLKRQVTRERADIKNTVKLHNNNAPSYIAFIVNNFLALNNTLVDFQLSTAPTWFCAYFFFLIEERTESKALGIREKNRKTCYIVPKNHSVEEFQGPFQV